MKDTSKCYIQGDTLCLRDGGTITYYHEQECCEWNYADFPALKDTGFFEDETITTDNIKFEVVDGYGFKINGYFVPCYSEQNGWYSTDLTITLYDKDGTKMKEFDLACEEKKNY